MVERVLAKDEVEGSNPFSRSTNISLLNPKEPLCLQNDCYGNSTQIKNETPIAAMSRGVSDIIGSAGWIRTSDPSVNSRLLYH